MISLLRWEATNQVPSFEGSSIEATASPGVFQSDNLIPPDLRAELLKSFDSLLDSIDPKDRDYHPGTEGKVLNLIHPSLYPFVEGRTPTLPFSDESGKSPRVLPSLNDPSFFSEAVEMKRLAEIVISKDETPERLWYSGPQQEIKFQWIPTDFSIDSSGKVKFLSYINNLHPEPDSQSGRFYPVVEGLLSRFVPLFEAVLSRSPVEPLLDHEPETWDFDPPKPEYDEEGDDEGEDFDERMEAWQSAEKKFVQPTIKTFAPPNNSELKLGDMTCQVIVKLASVELTPEKPEFEGGVWHVEGE